MNNKLCGALLVFFLMFRFASAQEELPAGFFQSDEPLEVTISAHFDELLKDREGDRQDHPARFIYQNAEGETVSLKIEMKTRGNFRRRKTQCSFPPLFVKIEDDRQDVTMFRGLKKMKLVTHCQKSQRYEDYILQEYLIYKAYNILTDKSFKVRLLKIKYFDEDDQDVIMERYGFMIENPNNMAERLNGQIIKSSTAKQRMLNDTVTNLMAVFNYFIANTDWSVSEMHNLKLVLTGPFAKAFPVPYDFDWSGVINARYAVPHPRYDISSIDERLYLGICHEKELFDHTFELFNQKKDSIYQLYRDADFLDEKRVQKILEFYDDFYRIINNPEEAKKEIFDQCLEP